jgi:hypothetical protein
MTAHLGRFQDRRLHAGGIRLPERLLGVGQRGVRVRRLGGDRANEMKIRRFLHDPAVTPEEMIETAQAHTAGLVGGQ